MVRLQVLEAPILVRARAKRSIVWHEAQYLRSVDSSKPEMFPVNAAATGRTPIPKSSQTLGDGDAPEEAYFAPRMAAASCIA